MSGGAVELLEYIRRQGPVVEGYIEGLAQYGAQPEAEGGGIVRPVYGPAWRAAHAQLRQWFEEAGLETRSDAVGNLWGRLAGQSAGGAIISGSHIDTVKRGGRYDGSLGVIAALCAVRFLKELYGPPRRSLEVVALCEEEGSRFARNFLGSRAITGRLEAGELEQTRDAEGISVAEAARECGFQPETLAEARRQDAAAFVELHIEQGRLLDNAGVEVGIVTDITGLQHLEIEFRGRADHAGTTPMDLRSDALLAAGRAVVEINRQARELGRPAVATVGMLEVEPGARNIVPERVVFSVDYRHPDAQVKERLGQRIKAACRQAAADTGCEVDIKLLMDKSPARMTPQVVAGLEQAAHDLDLSYMPMVSGAGHDTQVMVEQMPAGMVFVPSRAGRSHSAAEYTPVEQILPGLAVLARWMYSQAY